MRIPVRTTITLIFVLCMAAGHQSTALSDARSLSIFTLNDIDAFSKSEENLKDKLIFSHVLPSDVKTIVLDAGHGGKDRGCKGVHPDTKEKEIALALTLKLGNYIESYFPDIKVIYTRKEDVFVTLNRRAKIANEAKADLFISIHCNYIRNRPDVFGSETYVMGLHTADHNLNVAMRENASITMEDNFQEGYSGYDPDSPESHIMLSMFQNAYLERSILFAELVEQQIPKTSEGRHHSRGVRQAGFLVLKATAMPSVLIESGYLSHEKDDTFLRTKEGQKDVAFAIFKAFSIYKNVIEDKPSGEMVTASFQSEDNEEEPKPIFKNDEESKPKSSKQKEVVHDLSKAQGKEAEKITASPKPNGDGHIYMIQLAAAPTAIDLHKSKYAPLADKMVIKKNDGLLKYLYPAGNNHASASAILNEIKTKGFSGAFISVYKDDKRIKILYQ